MKNIEYYYNLIYYFFYRGTIRFFQILDFLLKPIKILLFFIAKKVPSIQKKYEERGITNPEEYFERWMKNVDENPSRSIGTMYGGGLAMSSLAFTLIGFYKLLKNLFYPEFQDSFGYLLIVFGLIAYTIDNFLVTQQDQGEKYIKQFNKIKDKRWRRKWAFITALTFPLSITFMVMASKSSYIGGFFFELHQYIFH